ncbi:hypothetical protein LCGC14_2914120, partial [marine sediment metagenome]
CLARSPLTRKVVTEKCEQQDRIKNVSRETILK